MNPAATVIEARGLTKTHKKVQELKSLDLEVRQHSIFGLLGPNGAGRTTTSVAMAVIQGMAPLYWTPVASVVIRCLPFVAIAFRRFQRGEFYHTVGRSFRAHGMVLPAYPHS